MQPVIPSRFAVIMMVSDLLLFESLGARSHVILS